MLRPLTREYTSIPCGHQRVVNLRVPSLNTRRKIVDFIMLWTFLNKKANYRGTRFYRWCTGMFCKREGHSLTPSCSLTNQANRLPNISGSQRPQFAIWQVRICCERFAATVRLHNTSELWLTLHNEVLLRSKLIAPGGTRTRTSL